MPPTELQTATVRLARVHINGNASPSQIEEARRSYGATKIADCIQKVLAAYPQPDEEQQARLVSLLRGE